MVVFLRGGRRPVTVALLYPCPVVTYLRCRNDADRPVEYCGDWPVRGGVYSGRILPAVATGQPQVEIDGFWANAPWGAFAAHRFEWLGTFGLN